jgi:hypothetical protein
VQSYRLRVGLPSFAIAERDSTPIVSRGAKGGVVIARADWLKHLEEAERFRRLAETTHDPALRQKLLAIAELHGSIARGLRPAPSAAAATDLANQPDRDYELELIGGREESLALLLRAASDIEAVRIAFALQEACSDFYSDFELSQATRRVAAFGSNSARRHRLLHLLGERALKQLLELENLLVGSGSPFTASRTLRQHQQQLCWKLRLLGASDP